MKKKILILTVLFAFPVISISIILTKSNFFFLFTSPALSINQQSIFESFSNSDPAACFGINVQSALVNCKVNTGDHKYDFTLKTLHSEKSANDALSESESLDTATVSELAGAVPLTVTFGGNKPSNRILNYQWNFGDGSSGESGKTIHTYSVAGTYTATLTMQDKKGKVFRADTTIKVLATDES